MEALTAALYTSTIHDALCLERELQLLGLLPSADDTTEETGRE